MAVKKKPSAKPRQTKSAKPSKPAVAPKPVKIVKPAVEVKPAPKPIEHTPLSPEKRTAIAAAIGMVVVLALLAATYFDTQTQLQIPKLPHISITLPEMPEMPEIHLPKLPELPKFSDLFPKKDEMDLPSEPEEDAAVEQEPAPEPQPEPAPTASDKELAALKRQLSDASERVQQLESIVQEKDKAIQYEIALRGKSLIGQYARLIEFAIEKGQPFPWELEQLQRFADNHMPEAVELAKSLEPYAPGVPSMDKLHKDFNVASEEVYQRWRKEDEGVGLSAVFLRMLHQIVAIRRIGLVEGNTPEAIVARAEYYLNKGDVARSVQELSAFDGSYGAIVKPWVDEASVRMEALKFTGRLHDLAQKVAPASAPAAVEEDHGSDLAAPPVQPMIP